MSYIEEVAEAIFNEISNEAIMPEDERGLYLTYAVLALTVGENVTRENVHDAWSAWKALRDRNHRSLRPFSALSTQTQEEDEPFVRAIRAVAERIRISA